MYVVQHIIQWTECTICQAADHNKGYCALVMLWWPFYYITLRWPYVIQHNNRLQRFLSLHTIMQWMHSPFTTYTQRQRLWSISVFLFLPCVLPRCGFSFIKTNRKSCRAAGVQTSWRTNRRSELSVRFTTPCNISASSQRGEPEHDGCQIYYCDCCWNTNC